MNTYNTFTFLGFEYRILFIFLRTERNVESFQFILIKNLLSVRKKRTYLRAKLYMEKAGSPVTSLMICRKGGKLELISLEGSVVKVSSKIKP